MAAIVSAASSVCETCHPAHQPVEFCTSKGLLRGIVNRFIDLSRRLRKVHNELPLRLAMNGKCDYR